jgi:uncharacterized protein
VVDFGSEFEWDPEKARINLRKHNVPFPMACEIFKDSDRIERPDAAADDEERWSVLGRVEQTILFVVYTQRGQRFRLISARRATRNEQRTYWSGGIQV